MDKDKLLMTLAGATYHLAKGMAPAMVQARLLQKLGGDEPAAASDDAVGRLFAFWVGQCRRDASRTQLTNARKQVLRARLRDSNEEEIRRAIRGCASSEWNMGANDSGKMHNDLTLICRSRDKMEGFMAFVSTDVVELTGTDGEIERLKKEMRDARTTGDVEKQNELSRKIRRLRSSDG